MEGVAFIRTLQHGFPAQKVGAAHLGGLEAGNAAAVEVVEDEPIVSLLLLTYFSWWRCLGSLGSDGLTGMMRVLCRC